MFNFLKKWFGKSKPESQPVIETGHVERKRKYKKHRKGSQAYFEERLYYLKRNHAKKKPTIPSNHDEICPACNPNSKLTVEEYLKISKQALAKNALEKRNLKKFPVKDFKTHDRPEQPYWTPSPPVKTF